MYEVRQKLSNSKKKKINKNKTVPKNDKLLGLDSDAQLYFDQLTIDWSKASKAMKRL